MKGISQAEIVARLGELGVEVSYRKLTDWASKGLLPHPDKIGLGQGRGTHQPRNASVVEQALATSFLMEFHNNAEEALLGLWFCGYQVEQREAQGAWIQHLELIKQRRAGAAANYSGGFSGLGKSWWRRQPQHPGLLNILDHVFVSDLLEWIHDDYERDDEALCAHIAEIVYRGAGRSDDRVPNIIYAVVDRVWEALQPQHFLRITELIAFVRSLTLEEMESARVQLANVREMLQHALKITNNQLDFAEIHVMLPTTRLMQDFLGPAMAKLVIASNRYSPRLPIAETTDVLRHFVLGLIQDDFSDYRLSAGALQRFETVKLNLKKLWELPDG